MWFPSSQRHGQGLRSAERALALRSARRRVGFVPRAEALEELCLLSLTFGPGTLHAVGASPQAIVTADLNRDNLPDLVTANAGDNSVSVLLGLAGKKGVPTGTFGAARTYAVGPSPFALAVGDFNGDRINDIVVGTTHGMSVLLGYGDGTFQPARNSAFTVRTYVAVADLNGDGRLDLVTDTGGVSVLLGNGDGTFQAGPTYPYTASGTAVAVGDFNADGKPDVVASGVSTVNTTAGPQQAATLFLLPGNGDGTFGAGQAVWDSVETEVLGVTTGDFNGDRTPDLVVASVSTGSGTPETWIHVNTLLGGSGGLSGGGGTALFEIVPSDNLLGLAAADVDQDGKADLFVVGADGVVDIVTGDGNGAFGNEYRYSAPYGLGGFAVGDFNGDGSADLAVTTGSAVDVFLVTSKSARRR